jgi:protein involved in polysaccharide export with SLBB domain
MKRVFLFACATALVAAVFGCSSSGHKQEGVKTHAHVAFAPVTLSNAQTSSLTLTNQLNPDLLRPGNNIFTLGPGDRVEIEIIGNPASRALTAVGPDGRLYFNLLPGLDVWGMTLAQTRDALESGLGKYLSEPHVTVTLREVGSKYVWLLGRLAKPGIYPMTGPMSLLEGLTLAGGSARSTSTTGTQFGMQELADLRHSFVMRQGQLLPVDFHKLLREGDMSQNIFLQPDDFVYVPSALNQQVFILGAVRFPRAVPYTERMTLMSAIAGGNGAVQIEWLAQQYTGIAPDAYLSHVAVVRGSLSQPELTVVDANAIMKGRSPDVPLEPGDIVFIPNAPYSTLKRYFNLIVSTFISTVAANAGLQAGGQQSVNLAVPVGTR